MIIKLAESYGFCFGVKRAIKIAEESKNATTIGPLIHNNEEIKRLKENFNVDTAEDFESVKDASKAIIRTHGIPKSDLEELQKRDTKILDATCPFVKKPQKICQRMSEEGYRIIIFGDINHPEVKGVKSYAGKDPIVVLSVDELQKHRIGSKVAVVSQTTKKPKEYLKIVDCLVAKCKETRVFNTICNATFENQEAVKKLSLESGVMVIVGGKNSSNTKQLYNISKENCKDSYLVENEKELQKEWFEGKNMCGISAGASTPEWIIEKIIAKIKEY